LLTFGFVTVYAQTFRRQTKTPVLRTAKVQLVMDIYCYEPVKFSLSLGRLWTTVCVSSMYRHRQCVEYRFCGSTLSYCLMWNC